MSNLTRRTALRLCALALPTAVAWADVPSDFAALEARHGGRLGVAALDTGSGKRLGHRDTERFPMCSTFKLLAVSAVLHRVDEGRESLMRKIAYGKADLLAYAPVTRAHLGEGAMTVAALCAAAIEYSDNTAANLLLAAISGPSGATAYARSLGDVLTRMDRVEPYCNNLHPGRSARHHYAI